MEGRMLLDPYSVTALPLEMRFRDTLLATGTGFVWRDGTADYLITNWHNVAGKNPRTNECLSQHAGVPDSRSASPLYDERSEHCPSPGKLPSRHTSPDDLYSVRE